MQWPWRQDNKDPDRPLVRVFDFDTQQFTLIPAAELAPGMMAVRMERIEGDVWVHQSQLKMSQFVHPPFPEPVREQLRQIQSALGEVYPLSFEAWEDGFRRDQNPEPEIDHWLHLSRVYTRFAAPDILGSTLAQRKAVFKVLVGCGVSPREQVLSLTDYAPLARIEAEQVVTAFYKGEGDIRARLLVD